jgi:hypothetical protein
VTVTSFEPLPYPHFENVTECKPTILLKSSECWNLLGNGNDAKFAVLPDVFTVDYYSWRDASRDRDIVWHEFTHAIQWDIANINNDSSGEDFKNAGSAFKEGMADFYPLSVFDHDVYSPWLRGRSIDPFSGSVETDLAWPYDRDCEPGALDPMTGLCSDYRDEHHLNGRIWSNFLWDLRKRSLLIEEELGLSDIGAGTVESLQIEALFSMPRNIPNWEYPLAALLHADEVMTNGQMSYEIVSSAARHGLKLTRGLAAVAPEHYFLERGTATLQPRFLIHSGANDSCRIRLSRDPHFPEGQETVSVPCHVPTCIRSRIQAATDDENLQFRCALSSGVFGQLAPDPDVVTPIFYAVETDGQDGIHSSIISGGGNTILHPDVPAIFIVPAGTPPGGGCLPVCNVGFQDPSLMGSASVLLLLIACSSVRRRHSSSDD